MTITPEFCTTCGRPNEEVQHWVAAVDVRFNRGKPDPDDPMQHIYICDKCVDSMAQLIAQQRQRGQAGSGDANP